jgi:hypothetical protein
MSTRTRKYFLLPLTALPLLAFAPLATADRSPTPTAGSESAGATVRDLKSEGYNVQINYFIGSQGESLDTCTVDNINTVDQNTAYVDVDCPL